MKCHSIDISPSKKEKVSAEGRLFIIQGGMLLIPEFDISYAYEAANSVPALVQTAGTNFTINGLATGRHRVTIGGGITGMLNDRIGFFVDYHVIPVRNLVEQTISAGLTYKF